MAVQVITRSVCDRCKRTEDRSGAHGDTPPVRWALVTITYRQSDAPGWSDSYRHSLILCGDCAGDVKVRAYNVPAAGLHEGGR